LRNELNCRAKFIIHRLSFIITLLFRTATSADLNALLTLLAQTMRQAFGPPHNPTEVTEAYIAGAFTPEKLAAEIADPRSTFFLAYTDDNELIGYARLYRRKAPRQMPERFRQAGQAIEIERLYLLQTAIGQGQGQQLMDFCLETARAEGYQAVWLGVWERNPRAIRFYERNDFVRFGWHYFQFGPDRQRDFWMVRAL
jgi:diamine N-acetyltransferase